MALTKIGATLGGSADVIQVTQSGHGLLLGYPVKVSGNGTYAHATADTAANAEAIGIVIATDAAGDNTNVTIALGGRITVDGALPSGNLAAGTVLFMATSASKLVSAPPTGNNEIVKPMAVVTYLNSEMIMLQHRGEVISTAGITLADGSVDNDAMADNAINTDEIVADAVTNAKLANMAAYTIKGNATSSSANPTDISLASATGGYSIDDADIVLVYDANGSALKTITRANFVAGISSALQSTVTYSSRTASAGSDNSVPYTGAGFAPTAVIIIAQGNTQDNISFGFGDDANAEQSVFARALGGTPVMERSGTYIINAINGSNSQRAALVSLDSGGMTLDWTKAGSGEAVNFVIVYLR